jgi:FkbM family methyltransferase
MELEIFKAVDGEMKADFVTRKGTHDPNIVQEIWDKHFYKAEGYEIKNGDCVVDIGAHIGSFTVWALHHGADIMAFEPDEVNFSLLMQNVQEAKKTCKGTTSLHNAAVRSIEGMFFIDRGGEGQPNTGGYKIDIEIKGKDADMVQGVDAGKMLSDVPRIDFLKLDCEGSEYDILDALAYDDILEARVKKVVMEWHFDYHKAKRAVQLLEVNGFTITEFSTNPDAPLPLGRIMAKK